MVDKHEDRVPPDAEVERLILSYLQKNRLAGDTVEGIVKWWMLRQRLTESSETIRRALDQLTGTGLIHQRRMLNGEVFYFARRARGAKPSPDR